MSVVTRAFDPLSARESWYSANETGMMSEDRRTRHRNDRNHL